MAAGRQIAELGADLAALIDEVGVELVTSTPLSRRGAISRVTAFRLGFADGTTLKASLLGDAAVAAHVVAVAAALPPGVARVIARRGAALLSEWIEGATLAQTGWTDQLLERCGALQARMQLVVPSQTAAAAVYLDRMRRSVRNHLDRLRAADLLSADEAEALAALAARHAPATTDAGVVLGDFCAENIVPRPGGEPCLIDVETLSLDSSDYDLGRTWYRWPMSEPERTAYLRGYARHRSPEAFLSHRPFWLIAALAHGANFRRQEHLGSVVVPLDGLRAVLREAAAGPR